MMVLAAGQSQTYSHALLTINGQAAILMNAGSNATNSMQQIQDYIDLGWITSNGQVEMSLQSRNKHNYDYP